MAKENKLEEAKETYIKLKQELERFKQFVSQPGWLEEVK